MFCGMSELDYNLPKTIQNEIDHTYDIELTPHNSIIQGNNLIFQIESGTDFTDLGNTFLSVELKMLKSPRVQSLYLIQHFKTSNCFKL